jgi:8-oxo-dGTP pyrophosphatase MutT (NUDIX family)
MRIVGCFLEYNDKFVILLRHAHKPDGNTWGLPGGKVEPDEGDEAAVMRELKEETGYHATAKELEHLGEYAFVSSSDQPYTFTAFRIRLKQLHPTKLEGAAHAAYQWVTATECSGKNDLIPGFHELLHLVGYVK